MDEHVRRWLRVQQELGGDLVILDRAIERPMAHGDRSVAPPPPRSGIPPTPTIATPIAAGAASPAADWRKDAPPIPGDGLRIEVTHDEPARWASLDEIAEAVRQCTGCALANTRTHAVPGEGDPHARLMLIGEGPGENEDRSGRPFVGRAGELLDRILESVGIARAETYIANVVKCRPPQNRVPLPDERDACLPFLWRQIALVRPRVLLTLGGTASEALLGVRQPLGQLRNRVHHWDGIPLIATYHPAALLRNPAWKRPAWDDIRIARQLLDRDV